MNRDLSRRIRTVNGLTAHKQIVRHDIKLSAKIVHNLDNRIGLWNAEKKEDAGAKKDAKSNKNSSDAEQAVSCVNDSYASMFSTFIHLISKLLFARQAFGLSSKNPVLKNITDYLIEEASAEEEELLGMSGDQEEGQLGGDGDGPVERDPALIKVNCLPFVYLDSALLYYHNYDH